MKVWRRLAVVAALALVAGAVVAARTQVASPAGPAAAASTRCGWHGWWRVAFDPAHPVTTPRGFDADDPTPRRALADAVQFFQANHIPLTLTPGQAQHYESVAIPGCTEGEGCFDRIRTSGPLGEDGRHPDVDTGSSFMMAVELTPDGPRSRTVLTSSESANPASPHHTDQTVLFSRGQWVTERFTETEIHADPHLSTTSLRG